MVELMYLTFFLLLLGGPIGGLCRLIEWAKGREARHQTEIRQRREARKKGAQAAGDHPGRVRRERL